MPRRSDIWRIGLVDADIEAVANRGLTGMTIRWLAEEPALTFLADPFGLWREGRLHVFAEAYDYRTRHGVIDLLRFGENLDLIDRRTVLREPWHLSYPFVFEADGQAWMAPEAYRSGALTLYRQGRSLDHWEVASRLELDSPAIDPSVFRHGGLWWIAYSPSGTKAARQERLHLAFAETLTGLWRTHPGNPVRIDPHGSRPGGTPFPHAGCLTLPVQDCSRTYGGAIRLLHIHQLTPDRFEADLSDALAPPRSAAPYRDGLHTLAGCGDVTLIDVKRIDRSLAGLAIDARRLVSGARRA